MHDTGLHLRGTLRSLTGPFLIFLLGTFFTLQANAWTFISSPDWFNQDVADLSGATPGIPEAEGWDSNVSQGLNGVSAQMLSVYDFIIGEMNTYSPELFLVAGDLINGRWFNESTLAMFDPDTRSRGTAIDNAANIYYPWYRLLFARHGLNTVIGALGDHELGDDDWPAGSEKAFNINVMKQAFGRTMVDTLGLPAQINGADARPYGTPFEGGSYAYQHNNLLVIAVDVFKQDDPNTNIHALFGTVSTEVSGAHLTWLATLLSAADQDPSIDHVIIQGHTPVLRPVRMQTTSGMMMVNREDSDFWQLLRQHDHRHGGKVRLYLCGEVHTVTASKDPESDIIQLVHGNPPWGAGLANVMVFNILPERIEIESREFVLFEDGTSLFWQVDAPVSSGPSSVMPSSQAGTLSIDTSGSATTYVTGGNMDLVDQTGLTLHFDFDQTTSSGAFSNTGSIGNHYYEGISRGGLGTQAGMFDTALQLNGSDAYMESGRGNITEGESRTVSVWIKSSSAATTQTVLSYGTDKSGINGRFNMQIDSGKLRLNIASGRSCVPDGASGITDGNWHHVAVVLTGRHVNRCADSLFYVDGNEFSSGAVNASARLDTLPWSNIRIGAAVSGNSVVNLFNGAIDDAAMWGSALPAARVKAIANAGRHSRLHYDALSMELLFDLFDAQQGDATVDDVTWTYIINLNASGGDILDLGDRIAIQLDDLGNGVVADMSPPPPNNFNLLCSEDASVNGLDPDCNGGSFTDGLWVHLWPESNVDSVDFYVDGIFNNTERLAPYELGGGSPMSFSSGSHTVRAVVNLIGGGSEEVSTTFTIGTTPSSYSLLCSSDSIVDGNDTSCEGGSFTDGLWVYLWPESNVDSVDFYVDGIFNNTERFAPYELGGGSPMSFSAGTHTVRAVVNLIGGGSEEVSTTFTIGTTPSSYSLLCSSDSIVDGNDTSCEGGSFTDGLWVYLWPESNVDSVDFYVDGIFNNTERFAPYELGGGSPMSFSAGTHTVRAVVNLIGGGSEEVSTTFTIGTTPSSYSLLCSSDSIVDGNDTSCEGGSFTDGLWVYLWPESNADSVDFYVDGIFNNTERFAPYELGGGSPMSFSAGTHTVRAVVNLIGGGSEEVSTTFTIGTTPSSYSLLCSSDSIVDGNDTSCDGGSFSTLTHPFGIWVYLWPEDRSVIDSVDYYMSGIFQRRENFAPWELLGGEPLAIPLSQSDYAITTNLVLFSGTNSPGPTAQFSYRP